MIGLAVLLVFAIVLAIVIGNRLSLQAMVIALGVAVGVAVGVPVGVLVATLKPGHTTAPRVLSLDGQRGDPDLQPGDVPTTIILTADQADALVKVLQRQQARPESFALTPRQQREFTIVGGADLPVTEEGDAAPEL